VTRHFRLLSDLAASELHALIDRAIVLKATRYEHARPLAGRCLAMVFQKSSTRTRVSFEVAMSQLGGHALFLSPRDTQLGRGEPLADTARVLSSMCDGIMVRNDSQAELEEIAQHSRVPVINGLTDRTHPCQLLADIQTFVELRGPIAGRRVAWIGDGNNVCNSFLEAARLFDFQLAVACPKGFEPDPDWLAFAGSHAEIDEDPAVAARNADLIVTDVWASMGQEDEQADRLSAFDGYQVNEALMKLAKAEALFMHCLPAHRGEEVTAEVIDGPQSVVWAEAENRMHAQKALLELLLSP